MGRRGPKAAPNHLKLVRGDQESRLNREEPIPSDIASIIPPDSLNYRAVEVWNRLAPDMIDKKMLTEWDVDSFAVFCNAVARYRQCDELMADDLLAQGAAGGVIKSPYWQIMRDCSAIMAQFSSRFGMTPGDRASLKSNMDEDLGPKTGAERILG